MIEPEPGGIKQEPEYTSDDFEEGGRLYDAGQEIERLTAPDFISCASSSSTSTTPADMSDEELALRLIRHRLPPEDRSADTAYASLIQQTDAYNHFIERNPDWLAQRQQAFINGTHPQNSHLLEWMGQRYGRVAEQYLREKAEGWLNGELPNLIYTALVRPSSSLIMDPMGLKNLLTYGEFATVVYRVQQLYDVDSPGQDTEWSKFFSRIHENPGWAKTTQEPTAGKEDPEVIKQRVREKTIQVAWNKTGLLITDYALAAGRDENARVMDWLEQAHARGEWIGVKDFYDICDMLWNARVTPGDLGNIGEDINPEDYKKILEWLHHETDIDRKANSIPRILAHKSLTDEALDSVGVPRRTGTDTKWPDNPRPFPAEYLILQDEADIQWRDEIYEFTEKELERLTGETSVAEEPAEPFQTVHEAAHAQQSSPAPGPASHIEQAPHMESGRAGAERDDEKDKSRNLFRASIMADLEEIANLPRNRSIEEYVREKETSVPSLRGGRDIEDESVRYGVIFLFTERIPRNIFYAMLPPDHEIWKKLQDRFPDEFPYIRNGFLRILAEWQDRERLRKEKYG